MIRTHYEWAETSDIIRLARNLDMSSTVLSSPVNVHDPIFTPLFTAIFGTATIAGTTITWASVAAAVATTALSIGIQALLTKTPKPEDGHSPKIQSVPYRIWGVGRTRLAGSYMLWEAKGSRLFAAQGLAGHRIRSVNRYWLNSDEVEIDANGRTKENDDKRYGDNVWIYHRIGLPRETAFSEIVRYLGSDNVWTNNHRGDGQASLGMICEQSPAKAQNTRFPQGAPQLSVEADLAYCWDFRDPSQDPLNPDTWAWSRNSVVVGAWHLCFNPFGFLRDYRTALLPVLDMWKEEADICDEDVPTAAGGTEKRYQCNGWDTTENGPKGGLAAILATCDGWICERGDGAVLITVGKFRETRVATLTDADIVGHKIQYDVLFEDECNRLIPKFTYPAIAYSSADADYFESPEDQATSGRVLAQEAQINWCHSWRQARRLAIREWRRIRQKVRGSLDVRLSGANAIYSRWVRLETPNRLPRLNGKVIENRKSLISLEQGGFTMDMTLHPENIDDWDPATDEGRQPPVPYAPNAEGIISPSVYSVAAVSNSSSVYLVIIIDDPEDRSLTPVIQYRVTDMGNGKPGAWVEQRFDDAKADENGRITLTTGAVPTDNQIEVQVALIGGNGAYGDWSQTEDVSTIVNPTPPAPVDAVGVSVGSSEVHYSWRSPNDTNYAGARIYYNTVDNLFTASAFSPATYGAPNSDQSATKTLAVGLWYSWIVSFNRSGIAGQAVATGPFEIT